MEDDTQHETSLGMDENIEALLCYSFGWVTGIIFLVLEKSNVFVRFHAMQALITFSGLTVTMIILVMIPRVGTLIASCLWFAGVALWAVLMWRAIKGEWFRLPLIGRFARNFANKSSTPGRGSPQG
jgi:uncharacterized membrane protein